MVSTRTTGGTLLIQTVNRVLIENLLCFVKSCTVFPLIKDKIAEKVLRRAEVTQSELSEGVKTEAAKRRGKKAQKEEVLKEEERYKAREISLCQAAALFAGPLFPPRLPVSVPSVTNYR